VQDHRVAPGVRAADTGFDTTVEGYETVVGPLGLRPLPADFRPAGWWARCWVGYDPGTRVSTRRRRAPGRPLLRRHRGTECCLVVAEPLLDTALGEGWRTGHILPAADIARLAYQRRSPSSMSRTSLHRHAIRPTERRPPPGPPARAFRR